MKLLDIYVLFIFLVKIVFIILAMLHLYYKSKGDHLKSHSINIRKNQVEVFFKFCMSILLIILFNPLSKKPIQLDYETKLLLFLFGFVLILTSPARELYKNELLTFKKSHHL